jgi:hypothetical protein
MGATLLTLFGGPSLQRGDRVDGQITILVSDRFSTVLRILARQLMSDGKHLRWLRFLRHRHSIRSRVQCVEARIAPRADQPSKARADLLDGAAAEELRRLSRQHPDIVQFVIPELHCVIRVIAAPIVTDGDHGGGRRHARDRRTERVAQMRSGQVAISFCNSSHERVLAMSAGSHQPRRA